MAQKVIFFIVIFFILVINLCVYTVSETDQVVVTHLGKPVAEITTAGLRFKIPFLQKTTYFDKRILDYDSAPAEIITKDKKNLVIDNFSKWKIVDPLKFMTTVYNEDGAQKRLDDIIYSELRVELGQHNLVDIVAKSRNQIMKTVTISSNIKTQQYGIEVIDVRIKRADLPHENASAIYGRMKAERNRIAKEYRSQGDEEASKIMAKTDKERTIMLSDAYKREQIIRGEGDAEAVKIYAEAFDTDPEFYSFVRTLEAYKKSFTQKDKIILSPDTPFLQYLK